MEQIGESLELISTGQWKNMKIYFLYQTGSLEAALTNPILAPNLRKEGVIQAVVWSDCQAACPSSPARYCCGW